jgi:hypothetical protein
MVIRCICPDKVGSEGWQHFPFQGPMYLCDPKAAPPFAEVDESAYCFEVLKLVSRSCTLSCTSPSGPDVWLEECNRGPSKTTHQKMQKVQPAGFAHLHHLPLFSNLLCIILI